LARRAKAVSVGGTRAIAPWQCSTIARQRSICPKYPTEKGGGLTSTAFHDRLYTMQIVSWKSLFSRVSAACGALTLCSRHTTRSFSGVPSKKLEQIQGGTKICQESSINEPKP
jgi:hypothetical protein